MKSAHTPFVSSISRGRAARRHAEGAPESSARSAREHGRNSHATKAVISLSESERKLLSELLGRELVSARCARRVRVILLSDDGLKGVEIARRLELSVGQVSRIRMAFLLHGASALADKPHPGRRDHAVPVETVAWIARLAASPPPEGRKRWSTRLIAARVGLTSATIAKVLRRMKGANASGGEGSCTNGERATVAARKSSPTAASASVPAASAPQKSA